MDRTVENRSGVIAITNLARIINPRIGTYQEHFLNERFGYTVRLSNGRIEMSSNVAHDYEVQPSSINSDQIDKVAGTFLPE